jgi:hypothetical protein
MPRVNQSYACWIYCGTGIRHASLRILFVQAVKLSQDIRVETRQDRLIGLVAEPNTRLTLSIVVVGQRRPQATFSRTWILYTRQTQTLTRPELWYHWACFVVLSSEVGRVEGTGQEIRSKPTRTCPHRFSFDAHARIA